MRKLVPTILGVMALTLAAPNSASAVPMTAGMSATAAAAAKDPLISPVYYRRAAGYRVARYGGYYGGYRGYGYRRYGYYGGYGYPYYGSYGYAGYGYPYYYSGYYPYYAGYGYPYYASYAYPRYGYYPRFGYVW